MPIDPDKEYHLRLQARATQQWLDDDDEDPTEPEDDETTDIHPNQPGDGRIVRKRIDDE